MLGAVTSPAVIKFLSTLSLRRATATSAFVACAAFNFYPRSPCGERPPAPQITMGPIPISIHALLAESDQNRPEKRLFHSISIHALLAESDAHALSVTGSESQFLSTLSLRRATVPRRGTGACHRDFYPRSPCGERRCDGQPQSGWTDISIHALLAESDVLGAVTSPAVRRFLSTLSLRRATAVCVAVQSPA